ncbi:hypothetical protein F3Y22_tig00112663pilonHSYRG00003 [Hibiscus syriacus]|uniref:Major facilitator superfamily (MFS) profile domain-containing protein n=1 Tax=Hibiscus syriacus TaxID=106335 RepID=A0A6A2WUJ0_HIBSY|nr:hypothetical protein F3Y22_tig00112663pilonHSYRG00003 [Hibiscus syriacus]
MVDKLGCRRTFQIDTKPLILGAIVSAQAHSLNEILLGRFIVGLGIGVNTVLVPIYISEVAPTKYRGSLGTVSNWHLPWDYSITVLEYRQNMICIGENLLPFLRATMVVDNGNMFFLLSN